jgi:hypothetical protein
MVIDHGDMRHDIKIAYSIQRSVLLQRRCSPELIDEPDLPTLEAPEGYVYYGLLEILDDGFTTN